MDIPKENIQIEKIISPNETIYYLIVGILIILGYLGYSYVYTEDFFQDIERRIIEFKKNTVYYTNQLLLKLNMEGDSIKSTQVTSI
jgi:hypothetical protein